ncbi:hypothetical protein C1645_826139 [Glomus cerebriforme]|uniref:Uncharacterized protein n=1 Tax=Glomus cerebriforme TaxID=658196 RepID=A0A397SS76_9GLOM|nr:hypothetical protein C1645_826139 [Glomus cerebriforme]
MDNYQNSYSLQPQINDQHENFHTCEDINFDYNYEFNNYSNNDYLQTTDLDQIAQPSYNHYCDNLIPTIPETCINEQQQQVPQMTSQNILPQSPQYTDIDQDQNVEGQILDQDSSQLNFWTQKNHLENFEFNIPGFKIIVIPTTRTNFTNIDFTQDQNQNQDHNYLNFPNDSLQQFQQFHQQNSFELNNSCNF